MENPSSENISYENEEYWKTQFLNDNAETFKAIDDYLDKGIKPKNDEFIFEKVPEILKAANVSENEIVIKTSIINKAKNEHSLSDEEIKDSIKNIASPVLIFNSDKTTTENKKESFLCLTDTFAENENGKPIAFSMNLDSDYERKNRLLEINEIRSIHDRTLIAKNGTDLIQKWTENGLCRYVDDKKISEWSKAAGVQFPLAVLQSDRNNILSESDFVNDKKISEWQLAAGVQFPLAVLHSDKIRIHQSDGFVNEVLSFSKFAEEQEQQEKEKEYRKWLSMSSSDEKQSVVQEDVSKEAGKDYEALKQYQPSLTVEDYHKKWDGITTLDEQSETLHALRVALDDYFENGKRPVNDRFIIGKTPLVLQKTGSDLTEVTVPVSVVKKAVETHGLSQKEVYETLAHIYNPILIFDSDKKATENKVESKLVLTDIFKDENPLALAVNVNSDVKLKDSNISVEVQDIRSVHDRTVIAKNGTDLIQKWANDGLCRYVDDKKITDWSSLSRVYFPIELIQSDNNKILTKSELVNSHTEVEQHNIAPETSEERNAVVAKENEKSLTKEAGKDYEALKQYQQKYPVSTLDVSSDVKEQLNIVFEQINSYFDNGIIPKDGRFILPEVPKYMSNTGSDKTPISLPVAVIKKARAVHQLNNDEIKNSILKLYDPIAVFESDKEKSKNKVNSKLILTDEFTNQSKPIVLAININSNIKISNGKKTLEVQDIRSIHDRTLVANNGTDLIQKWTQDGLCKYANDKKITEWSNVARVYFPIDELRSAENKILTKSELVNSHTVVEQRNVAPETSEERNAVVEKENEKSLTKEAGKDYEVLKQYQQKYPVSTLDVSEETQKELKEVFKQIDSYINHGTLPKNQRFTLPNTPGYLQKLGADNTEISLPVSVVKKAVEKHNLLPNEIHNAIIRLYDPMFAFEKTEGENQKPSLLMITDEFKELNPIILSLNINDTIKIKHHTAEVQDVRTIFDKTLTAKDGTNLIAYWSKSGFCKYVDDKKISDWNRVSRNLFPIELIQSDNNKILTKSELVNSHTEVEQRNIAPETCKFSCKMK